MNLMVNRPEILLGKYYNHTCDIYSFSIIMWQLLFDENLLFHHSYASNPKFTAFLSPEQVNKYSDLSESFVVVPKLVAEGLRLPIPSLPIAETSQMNQWVRDYFMEYELATEQDVKDTVTVLNHLFHMMTLCWDEDLQKRPSFSSILKELIILEKKL